MWVKKIFNEGNQIHNFMSSYGSGTVINYGSGSGSDFLPSYGCGSGSTSQKVTVPTVPVPVPQHWSEAWIRIHLSSSKNSKKNLDFYCLVTSFWLFIFEKWCKCIPYFWQLNDNFLGRKFYDTLYIGQNFYTTFFFSSLSFVDVFGSEIRVRDVQKSGSGINIPAPQHWLVEF